MRQEIGASLINATRPSWLPGFIPELDGLRGLAIITVVVYHCHERLLGTPLHAIAQWGWAGVNLFFVLSGFLITGIILESRNDPRFFRNFYARRSLRIWPVYVLLLALNYVILPLIFGGFWWTWSLVKTAPWLYYALFIQNLFPIVLPGAIGPTWSLAIEEQYYVVWAPLARFLRSRYLMLILVLVIIGSPWMRASNTGFLTKTHTLIHLDGIAFGSLIAVGLRTFDWSRAVWRGLGRSFIAVGLSASLYFLSRGSAFSDSALALLFGGMLLAAMTSTGEQTIYTMALKFRPIAFYGRISYGLYMMHILTFAMIGAFDRSMDSHGTAGNLAVVAVRLILSTLVATALWYGFEKPILKLKHRFSGARGSVQPIAATAKAGA